MTKKSIFICNKKTGENTMREKYIRYILAILIILMCVMSVKKEWKREYIPVSGRDHIKPENSKNMIIETVEYKNN